MVEMVRLDLVSNVSQVETAEKDNNYINETVTSKITGWHVRPHPPRLGSACESAQPDESLRLPNGSTFIQVEHLDSDQVLWMRRLV